MTVAVFGIAFRNRLLLRWELAYSAFCAAEWGVWCRWSCMPTPAAV